MPDAQQTQKTKWTFGRALNVANLVALLGVIFAAIDLVPKIGAYVVSARNAREAPDVSEPKLDKIKIIKTYPDGSALYYIPFVVVATNKSPEKVMITYSISQLFVGNRDDSELSLNEAGRLNPPPTPWGDATKGTIHWNEVAYDASFVDGGPPDAVRRFFAQPCATPSYNGRRRAPCFIETSPGAGLTGVLPAGADTNTDVRYYLRARPGGYVGVVVSWGIGAAVSSPSPDINLTYDFQELPSQNAGVTKPIGHHQLSS